MPGLTKGWVREVFSGQNCSEAVASQGFELIQGWIELFDEENSEPACAVLGGVFDGQFLDMSERYTTEGSCIITGQ